MQWSKIKSTLDPSSLNLGNYAKRLSGPDPWENFFQTRQSLKTAAKRIARL